MECWSYHLHLALWCSSLLGWLAFLVFSFLIYKVCVICQRLSLWFLLTETEQGVALAILRGVIDFKRDPWPQISESAKSLVRQMLNPDPTKRLTAQQVLGEVFFYALW